ncbi:MAG: S8 family serine peptidase [Verrucomicrobiales bacterium]|nr:S8 family serine peptidase [Verrucomicrobiales bacterium]MCP5558264.1 S8 family serine peptidase [Verrucomicrobiaceae bacterium]
MSAMFATMRDKGLNWILVGSIALSVLAVIWLGVELADSPAEPPAMVQRPVAAKSASNAGAAKKTPGKSSDTAPAEETAPSSTSALKSATDSMRDALSKGLQRSDVVKGEVLLTFKDAQALAAFNTRASFYGLRPISSDSRLLTARVKFTDLEGLLKDVAEHPGDYENVGLNYVARVPGLPAEPTKDTANAGGTAAFDDTALASIGATGDRTKWGKGVNVAVIDSGVGDHSTFGSSQLKHIDLVGDGSALDGHGTAMASLIGGGQEPADGVAPGVSLMDIRVTDSKGVSNTALVSDGIMRAVDEGAQVINISLGAMQDPLMLRRAVEYAISHNVVVVAAAGNEQMDRLSFPAGIPGVISVGAVDAKGVQAYFSNSGENLVISAPGVGVVSAYPNNQMVIGSGTSQATAITSGVVATLLARGYKAQDIQKILTQNAKPVNAASSQVGAGIVHLPNR